MAASLLFFIVPCILRQKWQVFVYDPISLNIKFPGLLSFIVSPLGRGLRVLLGVVMIYGGLAMGSTAGYLIGLVGIFPLAAGAFDVCLFGPLFGGPFEGEKMRAELHRQAGHPELGSKSTSWAKA